VIKLLKPFNFNNKIVYIVIVGLILSLVFFFTPSFLFSTKYLLPWAIIALGFGVFLFTYYKSKDIFHPIGIFSLMWITTIGLNNFKLSNLQADWSFKMWIVVFFVYISFILGYFLNSKFSKETTKPKTSVFEIDQNKFKIFIQILFAICFISYVAEVIESGFLPLFNRDPAGYKEFGIRFVHYLTVTLVFVNCLITVYFIKYKTFDKVLSLLYILSLLSVVSLLSRQLLIFLGVITLVIIHYLYKRIKLLHLSLVAMVGLIVFSLLGNIRSNGANYILQVGEIVDGVDPIFAWLYLYFGFGYENLNHYINNFNDLFYGTVTFFPVFAFTLTKGFIESDITQFLVSPHLTTSSMAYDFYLDFGIAGTIIIPLLIGMITSIIYKKLRSNLSVYNVLFYSMFAHNLLFVFFVNFFSNTSWFFNLFVLILLVLVTSNSLDGKFSFLKVRKTKNE
jgi:oligosaccharide repeat unit polymerase